MLSTSVSDTHFSSLWILSIFWFHSSTFSYSSSIICSRYFFHLLSYLPSSPLLVPYLGNIHILPKYYCSLEICSILAMYSNFSRKEGIFMRKKLLKSTLLTLLFSLLFSVNVFAAGFTQDATGIHYQNDDGTIVTSSWVEVNNLWFLFDANGICVNPTGALAPDDSDGNYQIVTSYTPFVTTDTALLNQCLTNGTVVNIDGQYFITPAASTTIRNTNLAATQPATGQQVQTAPEPTQEVIVDTPSVTPKEVWLSATGKKYHSISNCGNMNPKTARKVTSEEAQRLGKTACSKCL